MLCRVALGTQMVKQRTNSEVLELDVLFTSKWIFTARKVRNLRPGFQGLSFSLLPGVREEGRKLRGSGNEVWEFRAPLNWKLIWKPFLVSWGLQSVRQWFTKDLFSVGGFIFSFQTTWYSLENCAFIHLKIIHSYTRDHLKARILDYHTVWNRTTNCPSQKVSQ